MLESLAGVLQAIRSAGPRILVTSACASGALIFSPAPILEAMGLAPLVEGYRSIIGLVFLVSVVLLVTDLIIWAAKLVQGFRRQKQLLAGRQRLIESLTLEERQYLAPYVVVGENTCYYGIDDGIAGGLNTKGILYMSSNVGSLVDGIAFNMQPWAREALSKRLDLFNGITHRPPTPRDRFWSRW